TESRSVFQLGSSVRPMDVLGVVDQKAQPQGQRVLQGGQLEVPALEMLRAAREAGSLGELIERLNQLRPDAEDNCFKRSRAALLAVSLGMLGRDADAAALLRNQLSTVEKLPLDAPAQERWPELIALEGSMNIPALHKPLSELAEAANRKLVEAS